jgi:DNA-binding transcriptional regulator YbjK
LESSQSLTPEEEDLIMNLSATYLKRKEEWAEEVQAKIAINLLREGSTLEFIARTTGLSIESIEKLRHDQRSIVDHRI